MTHFGFWFNNHPLDKTVGELSNKFIPARGATNWVESELARAAIKLNHDYYNNGFGNNMYQPISYIEKYHVASDEFRQCFERISEAANQPWLDIEVADADFNTMISEIFLQLQTADQNNALTPITEEIYDMPYREIDYPAYSSFEEEEEE